MSNKINNLGPSNFSNTPLLEIVKARPSSIQKSSTVLPPAEEGLSRPNKTRFISFTTFWVGDGRHVKLFVGRSSVKGLIEAPATIEDGSLVLLGSE